MKAVTVISPGFEEVGEIACQRWRAFTGMEVDVMHSTAEGAHRAKLQAFTDARANGWRWLFDADWWPLHWIDVGATLGPWVAGCPIPIEKAAKEGMEYGYDPRCRVTTGFIAFDPNLPNWDVAMRLARQLQAHRGAERDELFFNAAVQHFGIPVRVLDSGWNWCFQAAPLYGYAPPKMRAVHAAGVAIPGKLAALQSAVADYAEKANQWSLDAQELTWLESFAAAMCARHMPLVCEFGPGASTHALLKAGCHVTTFETDVRAHCIISAEFHPFATSRLVRNAPGMDIPTLGSPADWVFVDGPPGGELVDGKSRWHALQWAALQCSVIVLHDALRDGEKASIAAMQAAGWMAHPIATRRGLCVLTYGSTAASIIEEIQKQGDNRHENHEHEQSTTALPCPAGVPEIQPAPIHASTA